MARIAEALLTGQGPSRGHQHLMLDNQFGGTNSLTTNYEEWVSTTHHVTTDIIPILIESPRFFDEMPDPAFWHSMLKSAVESHCKLWDGLKSTLSVESAMTAYGGAGEEFGDPTKVKREKSVPALTIVDTYGRPHQNFFTDWILYGIADPETNYPAFVTISGNNPTDWLADMYSCTVLFIQPDPTHLHVSNAWLSTNMYPNTSGPIEGKRDITAAGELLELAISFEGAITQTGHGVMQFATTVLAAINAGLPNANPHMRQAFIRSINASVAGNPAQGYKGQLAKISEEAVMAS